ncbi:DUF3866 family protein [Alkalicoccobacillus murimartini]|uniref:DUF3866 family protein n=1 Tax=Alkalicoccobacillus murimartini TaxID=171685 RepID=A0ABT9YDR1_9BACI|nr:DUF3866 family protein [Alkalicoccobacillus murimartini]MDQ0205768.1 hypothetical protein [Alkalicoccobacillus murimartini]
MNTERWTRVLEVTYEDKDVQLLATIDTKYPAIVQKRFTPAVSKGTYIKVNTTATELALGTGGYDVVKEVLASRLVAQETKGHIMRLRYTPLQQSVMTVEEPASPHHALFQQPFSLNGKKVLLGELHSMVPLACYVAKEMNQSLSCCVIFDDTASLLLDTSHHVRTLKKETWFHSITIGQSFGGEFEAVSLPSALQFASQSLQADLIMISVGPGVVGTGTVYGNSAVDMAGWANTVGALDGKPVWIPRLSFADRRHRHYGLSHHTVTPLCTLTYAPSILPFPYLDSAQMKLVKSQLSESKLTKHHVHYSTQRSDSSLLNRVLLQLEDLTTMGRGYADDPLFFEAILEAACFCVQGKTS